jgi:hypothetical protein
VTSKPWANRIRGLRANASSLDHGTLFQLGHLEEDNPDELTGQYVDIRAVHPKMNVFGGCGGTDYVHVEKIGRALLVAAWATQETLLQTIESVEIELNYVIHFENKAAIRTCRSIGKGGARSRPRMQCSINWILTMGSDMNRPKAVIRYPQGCRVAAFLKQPLATVRSIFLG